MQTDTQTQDAGRGRSATQTDTASNQSQSQTQSQSQSQGLSRRQQSSPALTAAPPQDVYGYVRVRVSVRLHFLCVTLLVSCC